MCDEKAYWVIVPKALELSKEQLNTLRNLKLGDYLANYSPCFNSWHPVKINQSVLLNLSSLSYKERGIFDGQLLKHTLQFLIEF